MARLFDEGDTEYLTIDQCAVTAYPISIATWFRSDAVTSSKNTMVCLVDKGEPDRWMVLALDRDGYSGEAMAEERYGDIEHALSGVAAVNDTWTHAIAVFASTTSRIIYQDGSTKVEDTNALVDGTAGYDRMAMGMIRDSSPSTGYNGQLAEVGIWNAALSDAEALILAAGYSPLFVRPQNLVAYWPLIRDSDIDIVGGYTMTPVNGPTIAAHPGIIRPKFQMFIPAIVVGGAEYEKAIAGAFAFTGNLIKKTSITPDGAFTFSGTVGDIFTQVKSIAGVVSFSGAVGDIFTQVKSLAGTFGFSGTLARRLSLKRLLTGSFGFSGSVGNIFTQVKALAGAFSFSGALAQRLSLKRLLTGVFSFSGSVGNIRTRFKALAGVFSFSGAVSKLTSISLAGVFTFAGGIGKAIKRALAGVLTFVGSGTGRLVGWGLEVSEVHGELTQLDTMFGELVQLDTVTGELAQLNEVFGELVED